MTLEKKGKGENFALRIFTSIPFLSSKGEGGKFPTQNLYLYPVLIEQVVKLRLQFNKGPKSKEFP